MQSVYQYMTLLGMPEITTLGYAGRLAQSGASLTANQGVAGSSPCPATYVRADLS